MSKRMMRIAAFLIAVIFATQSWAQETAPLMVSVVYDASIADSFTGRVYVMTSKGRQEPRFGPNWFAKDPFYAVDVKNWRPGMPLLFNDSAVSFPTKLSKLEEGEYAIQAVMRRNVDSHEIGSAAGNAYSAVVRQTLDGQKSGTIALRIDQVVEERPFQETDRIKLVEMPSEYMKVFFEGKEKIMRAAVILPTGYDDPANAERQYPALYWIGGFGSTHHAARFMSRGFDATGYGDQIVRIVLDPSCYGGHHVFADSQNNGPVATALTREFIPHLEEKFRLVASPNARFLSGHSSGGWSSLWLQVTHADFFGGVWSIAPDPVDFRDFQRIDLYRINANMYVDEKSGERRPLARQGDEVKVWYDEFCRMEMVYGEGGQIRSFEWVFSPRGPDGLPLPLFDRITGLVDANVAKEWIDYDIRLFTERYWSVIGPHLNNGAKINVFMGDVDTFYLEGATKLLKQSQLERQSKAVIEIEPGKDHSSIATPELRKRIDRELMATFTTAHPEFAPEKYAKKETAK